MQSQFKPTVEIMGNVAYLKYNLIKRKDSPAFNQEVEKVLMKKQNKWFKN